MNKVILMGRLTRDPNVRCTQQNGSQESMCVARYTLAVDRRGARDGQQSADFISCVAFGKNGEFAEKYLKQGTKIVVTGRIQTGSYTNRDGQKVCEADCSSGVAAIVKGAGYRLGIDALKKVSTACYTGNLRAALKAAGFEVLTENKYLTSDAYLLAGDILLNDGAHTATNLTDGAKSSGAGASNTTPVKSNTKVDVAYGFDKSLAGTYKVTASGLNLRAGAGTGKSILAVMENGEKVQCYGYYNDCNGVKWLYVVYKNIVGYASSKYLSK